MRTHNSPRKSINSRGCRRRLRSLRNWQKFNKTSNWFRNVRFASKLIYWLLRTKWHSKLLWIWTACSLLLWTCRCTHSTLNFESSFNAHAKTGSSVLGNGQKKILLISNLKFCICIVDAHRFSFHPPYLCKWSSKRKENNFIFCCKIYGNAKRKPYCNK